MQTIKHRHYTSPGSGSFIQALWGFALVVMVVLGICGTLYKLLAPAGWIATLMGRGFSGGVAAIGMIFIFSVLGWVARSWMSTRQQMGVADLAVYAFAAAGLLYSFQLWSKGVF